MDRKPGTETPEPEAPVETPEPEVRDSGFVTCRITTDRGPFWKGSPLPENAVVDLPRDVFDLLRSRKWAEEIA